MILPALVGIALLTHDPAPAAQICEEMSHDIRQGVEFGIITEKQANKILLRCLINYSSGPSPYTANV